MGEMVGLRLDDLCFRTQLDMATSADVNSV